MKMKPVPLPPVKLGIDTLSPEGELPEGAVRWAENVILTDGGGFIRRPGLTKVASLSNCRSLWRAPSGRVLMASGDSLFDVTLGNPATGNGIFTGLPLDATVSYADAGNEIYFCAPGVLGKITAAGQVRKPGVATLHGSAPALIATTGGLLPGKYGVAYSLTNDLGEESGLSSLAWIDLTSGGGILLDGIANASNVTKINLYVTAANGTELYLHSTQAWTSVPTIRDRTLGRVASKLGRAPMPGGQIVRFHNGRLYVADGAFVYISDPFDRGVFNVMEGWIKTAKRVTLLEPVRDGIFIGDATRVSFYRGGGPGDHQHIPVFNHGAIEGTGVTVAPEYFSTDAVPDQSSPVAAWLADCGVVIGTANGSVVPVQVSRIQLAPGDRGTGAFFSSGGIGQAVFSVGDMVVGVGGPTDTI